MGGLPGCCSGGVNSGGTLGVLLGSLGGVQVATTAERAARGSKRVSR